MNAKSMKENKEKIKEDEEYYSKSRTRSTVRRKCRSRQSYRIFRVRGVPTQQFSSSARFSFEVSHHEMWSGKELGGNHVQLYFSLYFVC